MGKDIENTLKNIISDIDEDADLENLDYNAPLKDQIDLDSMDFLDIIMELRKEYRIGIPEDDYKHFVTMSGGIDYLSRKV